MMSVHVLKAMKPGEKTVLSGHTVHYSQMPSGHGAYSVFRGQELLGGFAHDPEGHRVSGNMLSRLTRSSVAHKTMEFIHHSNEQNEDMGGGMLLSELFNDRRTPAKPSRHIDRVMEL